MKDRGNGKPKPWLTHHRVVLSVFNGVVNEGGGVALVAEKRDRKIIEW